MLNKKLAVFAVAGILLISTGCSRPTRTPLAPPTTPPARSATQYPAPSASATPVLRDAPLVPSGLEDDGNGQPVLNVYRKDTGATERMAIEKYLEGVLAGEMRNDWPMEALKAQAIIARTFVLKFIEDKGGSMYEGADVSTDTQEAQAYNAQDVNERIVRAIAETSGEVITQGGHLTYSWFHSHSGGVTAEAKEGLEWEGDEPAYIQSVSSSESDQAPDDVQEWTARFPVKEVEAALTEMGFSFDGIKSFGIGQKGPSGRTTTFDINGTQVTAPSLRVRLDPAKFKSTLLTGAWLEDGVIAISGKGYGHGVGMSQWGAYRMAEEGKSAEEIILAYYTDVEIEKAW